MRMLQLQVKTSMKA